MGDLVDWLKEQLAADEAAALKAHGGWGPHAWDFDPQHREVRYGQITIYGERQPHGYHTSTAELLARHDPPRVLAEVAAKRQILDEHERLQWGSVHVPMWVCLRCWDLRPDAERDEDSHTSHLWPCRTLRLLAAPYAGQPGYLEEWAP